MSTLETALDILDCFGPSSPELAVTDVARRLGIAKSTVSRVMKTMTGRGMTEQSEESRRYSVGPLPLRLGQLYRARMQTLDLVAAATERLANETGFTGYVGVLDGADVVILRMTQGGYPVRIVLEPGYRVAAFATAMGRALLAQEADTVLRAMLPSVLTYKPTGLRITLPQLLRDLATFRRQGFVQVSETTFPGIRAVGAAVRAPAETRGVGFALSFPVGAADASEQARIVAAVQTTADTLAARVGDNQRVPGREERGTERRTAMRPGRKARPAAARANRTARVTS